MMSIWVLSGDFYIEFLSDIKNEDKKVKTSQSLPKKDKDYHQNLIQI